MEKTRFQKQQAMALQEGYWATRAVTQLRYLEELLKSGQYSDTRTAEQATDALYGSFLENGTLGKKQVLVWEQEYLEQVRQTAKSLRVDCVGHAHIDMNWLWAYDETVVLTIDTFRTMLRLMDEYPDFVYLQSQASVYRIVEQYAPEMLPAIREKIKKGQWEVVAATWVEADKNMASGESMTRHLLYTRQYLKDLLGLTDDDFRVDFEPDTFGHSHQVPAVLASGGVKYYYHCRGNTEQTLYRWQAPSGECITVLRDPTWYNDSIGYDAFLYIPQFCTGHGLKRMAHVFGVGDHGGGATRRDLERIHDMASWPCMPEIGFGKLRDFFDYASGLDMPVITGEQNFIFDGCYTTESRIKRGNRQCESALYNAEYFNAMSSLRGTYAYDSKAFAQAWEKVLFNQFHDILPGSGIAPTREHAMGTYQEALACAGVRTGGGARGLSMAIDTTPVLKAEPARPDSASEGAGVGFGTATGRYTSSAGVTGGEKRLFHVFNSTQVDWDGLVELTVWDWHFTPDRAMVCDEEGRALPVFVVDGAPQTFWAHQFFRLLVKCPVPAFGYRTLLVKENDTPVAVPFHTDPRLDAPTDAIVLENDCIRVELDRQSLRICSLRDAVTGKEYLKPGTTGGFDYVQEDDFCGMIAWRVGRHISRRPAITQTRITEQCCHPLRSSVSYTAMVENSRIHVSLWLDKGSRMLHTVVRCQWLEVGRPGEPVPQLSFSLPLAQTCEEFLCDTPFMSAARRVHAYDVPALTYACASGILLTTDCKYGFRCTGDALSVTLIRSAYEPDDLPEIGDHDILIGVGIPENSRPATLLAESLRFRFTPMAVAAMPHKGSLSPSGKLFEVTGNVQVSSVKCAEDGSGDILVRLVNLEDKPETATIRGIPVKQAWLSNAHEEKLSALPGVSVELRPYGIAAIRCSID